MNACTYFFFGRKTLSPFIAKLCYISPLMNEACGATVWRRIKVKHEKRFIHVTGDQTLLQKCCVLILLKMTDVLLDAAILN